MEDCDVWEFVFQILKKARLEENEHDVVIYCGGMELRIGAKTFAL